MVKTANIQTLTKQTRVAVLYGGMSSEREVSLRSGNNCFEALQRLGYTNSVLLDVGPDIAQRLKAEQVEVAYLALHGKYGEDGCIQGLLEIAGIPYTGCRVTASGLTMNKALTKIILKEAGLPIIPSVTINLKDGSGVDAARKLAYPVMAKPLTEGSSYGMSKVDSVDGLDAALELAGQYSRDIMVEEFVKGKSITVGIFERDGRPVVTPILELRPVKSEWYDLEAKYTEGLTEFILPAELPEDVATQIQEATKEAHRALDCRGMSRTDFMVSSDNRFYILEINTIPGMTNLSDLPAQAKAMGVGYDELVECILKSALSD